MLTGLFAMPSTALAHPAVTAGGVAGVDVLREAVAGLLAGRSPWDPVVVAAADPAAQDGPVVLEPQGGLVHLGGLGLSTIGTHVIRPPLAVPTVAAHPGADLAVLAALVGHHWPAARIGVVGLPADQGDGLATRIVTNAESMTVVVAGDLAAGHGPKPPRPAVGAERAAAFDAAVIDALDDADAVRGLAADAGTCGARGLPGLILAAELAGLAGRAASEVVAHRVAGVGGVTGRWD